MKILENIENVVLFGAGVDGRRALDYFGRDKVLFFIDNNPAKVGKNIGGIEILSLSDYLKKNISALVVITVDIRFLHLVARQLEENGIDNYISFYEIRNKLKKSDLLYSMYSNLDLSERFSWILAHSNISDLKVGTGYLRKKQLDILEFCKRFFNDIACLDIHPFLEGGSLIGAIRHKGFVPWDDDMDFGLMRDEYDRLIEYAKKHFVVRVNEDKKSEADNDTYMTWIDTIIKDNPEQYVFDIHTDLLQVNYGTSCIDRISLDFFVYDYYDNDYTAENHKEYLKSVIAKKDNIDNIDKIVEYLELERKSNPMICSKPTDIIFPGIDCIIGNIRVDRFRNLLRRKDFFPLKKVKFEDVLFYAPNDVDGFLEFEFPGYMSYPDDACRTSHLVYKEKYMAYYMPTVDFYVGDTEDILYFKTIYDYFEHNGIYSRFLLVKQEYKDKVEDTSLITAMEKQAVRYYISLYSDSDCVLFAKSNVFEFEYKKGITLNKELLDTKKMETIKEEVIELWKKKENKTLLDS